MVAAAALRARKYFNEVPRPGYGGLSCHHIRCSPSPSLSWLLFSSAPATWSFAVLMVFHHIAWRGRGGRATR